MEVGEVDVEPNVRVRSLGRERGRSEPRRLLAFYRIVGGALRERPIHVAFAHQAPLFALLFRPLPKRDGVPDLLWYAHGAISTTLRAAHHVVDRCITASESSFRIPSDKLLILGHGVDTDVFHPPQRTEGDRERTLISVGRLSAVKRLDELVRNDAFAAFAARHGVEELVSGSGAVAVAARLEHVLALAPERRVELRRKLREAVRAEHGLDRLIDAITAQLVDLATASGRV